MGKRRVAKVKVHPTGKIILHNETNVNQQWTPNGQNVTLKIGSTEVRLAPGQRFSFQPKDNRSLTIEAKPKVKVMQKVKAVISHPLSMEDHHIEIVASPVAGGKIGLTLR